MPALFFMYAALNGGRKCHHMKRILSEDEKRGKLGS